jgi:hypothetical protein
VLTPGVPSKVLVATYPALCSAGEYTRVIAGDPSTTCPVVRSA